MMAPVVLVSNDITLALSMHDTSYGFFVQIIAGSGLKCVSADFNAWKKGAFTL
jgi:hypothetical protein